MAMKRSIVTMGIQIIVGPVRLADTAYFVIVKTQVPTV